MSSATFSPPLRRPRQRPAALIPVSMLLLVLLPLLLLPLAAVFVVALPRSGQRCSHPMRSLRCDLAC
jgi:hypothetical protein